MAAELRHTLHRLLQLWRVHAYLDLTFILQSRKTFLMYILSDIVVKVGQVSAALLLAARFAGIGPWSREQIAFMLGYAILADGGLDIFFNYNVKTISRRLGRGQLDHTLVQPQPLWLALLTEGFTPVSGPTVVLPGLALVAWSLGRLGLAVTPGWLALLVNLVASAVIVLAFSFLWGSLAFWAPRGAEEISSSALRALGQVQSYPLDGIGAGLQAGLLSALPAGFVAWFPCRALLGLDPRRLDLVLTPLATLLAAALATMLFRNGLRHYARTGSQRYLDFGFRR